MIELKEIEPSAAQTAAAIMHDALPIPEKLWQIINDPDTTTFIAEHDGVSVGAAIVRWGEQSEIEVLGVAREKRRQGIGQAIVAQLVDEARTRGHRILLVGTASISLDNIMFYQKCGFRMSAIRRDFFDQHHPGLNIVFNGVRLHDMIVFDYEL